MISLPQAKCFGPLPNNLLLYRLGGRAVREVAAPKISIDGRYYSNSGTIDCGARARQYFGARTVHPLPPLLSNSHTPCVSELDREILKFPEHFQIFK